MIIPSTGFAYKEKFFSLYNVFVESLSSHIEYFVGIDEAGRGPLAGPVSVTSVTIHRDIYARLHEEGFCIPYTLDSKILSEKRREEMYKELLQLREQGDIEFSSHMVGNTSIDREGISKAVKKGIKRSLRKVSPHNSFIFLDGSLRAPIYFQQKTVTKGDSVVPIISLASIISKVRRDRRMKKYGKEFPEYNFEQHKGYGTKKHIKSIKKNGICRLHRATFLGNLTAK